MARPREFDPDAALDRAMEAFWTHGYAGAALPVLLDGMGITRGSLYKAFGDKKSLFLAALRRYEARVLAPAEALLTDPAVPGHDRLSALHGAILDGVRGGDRRGCLVCMAAGGAAAEDAEIAAVVAALLARMRAAFADALGPDRADAALSHYVGLRTQARAGVDLPALEAAARGFERLVR